MGFVQEVNTVKYRLYIYSLSRLGKELYYQAYFRSNLTI